MDYKTIVASVTTVMDELQPGVCTFSIYGPYIYINVHILKYKLTTDVTIMYGPSEVPVFPVLFSKKHFNYTSQPIGSQAYVWHQTI